MLSRRDRRSLNIGPARPDEAVALTRLALASKAHWGYDDAFMERCRAELVVRDRDLSDQRVFVARAESGELLGFYLLIGLEGTRAELDMLFVEPAAIGTGVGGALVRHALEAARGAGFTHVLVTSDPFAATFYEHAGARHVGFERSPSTGRDLPRYEFELGGP